VDVGAGEIALVVGQQAGVHDTPPQRRNDGEQDHAGIAGRQLGRLVEVAQRLVAAQRVGVMVGVALQVVEQNIGGDVVGVPAVLWSRALVTAVLAS
jgi:hypothetical protein